MAAAAHSPIQPLSYICIEENMSMAYNTNYSYHNVVYIRKGLFDENCIYELYGS